jgi:hypothetical protein|tara:strand:+ start:17720 stop:18310 length:591 start_codon:yes stop_codon:yes gene_type:complete
VSTIVLRNTKGSALSFTEGDANFTNLNNDKLELTNLSVGADASASGTGGISYNNATGSFTYTPPIIPSSGIGNVVDDASPQLGGALDAQGEIISNPVFKDYAETIEALGSNDAPTLTVSSGNVKTVTITNGLTLGAFSDAATGQSVTLIVSGGGNVTGTGAYKFANGTKTLTSDSVISIFYDGTTYWTSVATNYTA